MCRLPHSTALTCPFSNWLVAPNTAFENGHYGRQQAIVNYLQDMTDHMQTMKKDKRMMDSQKK
jgi:hypothetical protein